MKKWLIIFSLLLGFIGAEAQNSTTVTGLVQDSTGITWINGTISATFYPTPNTPGPFVWSGGNYNTNQGPFNIDNTGHFSISIPSNLAISPAGSQWTFNICPNATLPCTQFNVPIYGASQDISTIITQNIIIQKISSLSIPKAYSTNQLNPIPALSTGAAFFNSTTGCYSIYDGINWGCLLSTTNAIFSNPSSDQTITQPINTNFTIKTSGTGTVNINNLNKEFWVASYSGGDIGAKINTLLSSDCPTDSDGYKDCIIHLPATPIGTSGSITSWSTAVVITSPRVSLIGSGSTQSKFNCTVSTDCLRLYTSPFTTEEGGRFIGFTIIGNNGPTQNGIHMGDIVGSSWRDVEIVGMGNGSCLLMDDADVGQGSSSGWTERNSFDQVTLAACSKLLRFIHTGGLNSFGYNMFNDLRMSLNSGQTAISVENDSFPYHMTFNATVNGPGNDLDTFNIFNIQDTAGWNNNVMNIRGETGGNGCTVKQSGGGFFWSGTFTGFESFDSPSCYTGGGHAQFIGALSPAPVGGQINILTNEDVVVSSGSVLSGLYYLSYTGNNRNHRMIFQIDANQFNTNGKILVLGDTSYVGGISISNPRIVLDSNSMPQFVVTLSNLNGGGTLESGFFGEITGSQTVKLFPNATIGTTAVTTPIYYFENNGTFDSGALKLTSTTPTVSAGQIGFGTTTAAPSNCNAGGTITGVTGCEVRNIGGTNHYIPYF